MEGIIKKIKDNYGFIKVEGEEKETFFSFDDRKGFSPEVGMKVSFEKVKGSDGRYKAIKLKKIRCNDEKHNEYKFFNPYNFVSNLDKSEKSFFIKGKPVSHSVYNGLTGSLVCNLNVITPLFIGGGKQVKDKNDHAILEFFKINGEYVIPSSSIRGMVRSVYEAVTNSCYSVFDNQQLYYRSNIKESINIYPARIIKNKDDEYKVKLLKGFKDKYNKTLSAGWIRCYDPLNKKNVLRGKVKGFFKGSDFKYDHKERAWAVMEYLEKYFTNEKGENILKYSFWNVIEIFKDKESAESFYENEKNQNNCKDIILREGWVAITGQNMENKHDEKFFFGEGEEIVLDEVVRQDYAKLIMNYKNIHENEIIDENNKKANAPKPGLSHYLWESEKLEEGDLVYAAVENRKLKYLLPVQKSRRPFKNTTYDLLEEYLIKCNDYESLCPACRLFGWTKNETVKNDERKTTAYGGRVSFSMAKLSNKLSSEIKVKERTLAELSTPKPTTTFFYLKHKNNGASYIKKEDGYNKDNQKLSGRKFYRHHRNFMWQTSEKTKRNTTIKDAIIGDNDNPVMFDFTVRFENLTNEELGALIWCLRLEEGMFNRLGYAKPLGLGSVKIEIEKLKIFDFSQRYKNLYEEEKVNQVDIDEYIKVFKNEFRKGYNKEFEENDNIKDLKSLLSNHNKMIPIHYPVTKKPIVNNNQIQTTKKDENFRWFMNAKNKNQYLHYAKDDNGLLI